MVTKNFCKFLLFRCWTWTISTDLGEVMSIVNQHDLHSATSNSSESKMSDRILRFKTEQKNCLGVSIPNASDQISDLQKHINVAWLHQKLKEKRKWKQRQGSRSSFVFWKIWKKKKEWIAKNGLIMSCSIKHFLETFTSLQLAQHQASCTARKLLKSKSKE